MNITRTVIGWFCVFSFIISGAALAAPPYDVTVTFSPPTTGGAPDGYSLYIDDCAVTGAIGLFKLDTAHSEYGRHSAY